MSEAKFLTQIPNTNMYRDRNGNILPAFECQLVTNWITSVKNICNDDISISGMITIDQYAQIEGVNVETVKVYVSKRKLPPLETVGRYKNGKATPGWYLPVLARAEAIRIEKKSEARKSMMERNREHHDLIMQAVGL